MSHASVGTPIRRLVSGVQGNFSVGLLSLNRRLFQGIWKCVLTESSGAGNMRANFAEALVVQFKRGIAQSGSAPALGAGCREFESLYPDHFSGYSGGRTVQRP